VQLWVCIYHRATLFVSPLGLVILTKFL